MASKLTYVLFTLLLTSVMTNKIDLKDRQKRGDDGGPLSIVVDQLSQQLNTLTARQDSVEAKVNSRLAALEAKTDTLSKVVAFHAYHTTPTIYTTPHGVLIFDRAVTNTGQGYDPTTGIFTAPVAGDYTFLATILQIKNNERVDAVIMVDNVHVARGIAEGATYNNPSSIHAVVHLHVGSKVKVINPDDTVKTFHGMVFSTFSGFLIKAD